MYCLSSDLRLLFTSLVSLGHCIVCPLVYDFSLPLWYLLVIVLSVLWFMSSDIRFLFTSLVFLVIVSISWSLYCLSSVFFTTSVYSHCIVCPGISWSLYCLSSDLRVLFGISGHCIVCPLIYDFCLPSWSLYCLSSDLRLLFLGHLVLSVLIYDFCLPLWFISLVIVCPLVYDLFTSLRLLFIGIVCPLFTSLVSLGHCIVFCLSLWSVLSSVWFSWSLYCLSSGL